MNTQTAAYIAPTVKTPRAGAKMSKQSTTFTAEQMAELQSTAKILRNDIRRLIDLLEFRDMMSEQQQSMLIMESRSAYLHLFEQLGIDLDSVMVADKQKRRRV